MKQPIADHEQEMVVDGEYERESNIRERRQGVSLERDLKEIFETGRGGVESSLQANDVATKSSEVEKMHSTECGSNMAEFRNKIRKLKEHNRDKLATKCYQLKIHRTKDDDFEKIIRDFDDRETQPILDKIKLIKDQWRTIDLWGVVQLINPSPVMDLDREELLRNETFSDLDIILRKSIVLCCIFEDLMRKFGWKVGDTLDIEEDICDVVGKLIMNVNEQDRLSMLICIQTAVVNFQAGRREQDSDKLRSLFITKKKYNGLNLACILLEQMILDNKDNNVSWMRIVCAQFIDLVVPLIIEPAYRTDIHWNLNYLMKLGSLWSVADIYDLMRNGMLLYHQRQIIFHRHLVKIRNFAVSPSLNACLGNDRATTCLESIFYCRDENTFMCVDDKYDDEEIVQESIDQVFNELNVDRVGQGRKDFIRIIIENSQKKLEKYKDNFKGGIEQELERIRNSEQKDGIDVLSSCLIGRFHGISHMR